MAYYVMGKVVDEKNNPLVGVVIDDGSNGVVTDANGDYSITTNNKSLNYRFIGFENQTFDLSKYTDESSINGNIVMKENEELQNKVVVEADSTNRKVIIGISTAIVTAIATYYIAKKYTKSMPIIIGGSILVGVGGYFSGLKLSDYVSQTIDKKRQNG